MESSILDVSPTIAEPALFSFDSELTHETRLECHRLSARSKFDLCLLLTVASGCFAIIFLSRIVGEIVATWQIGSGNASDWQGIQAPLWPAAFYLLLTGSHALNAGRLWALWQGKAAFLWSPAERENGNVRYSVARHHIVALAHNQTEAWHSFFLSKPIRLGRFVVWRRAGGRFFFMTLPSDEDARRLSTEIDKLQGLRHPRGFGRPALPETARFENISSGSAHDALMRLSRKIGTPCPGRMKTTTTCLSFLIFLGLSGYFTWSMLFGLPGTAGLNVFDQIAAIVMMLALVFLTIDIWAFLPKFRHMHYFRRGLMRGFDWGPTAVNCDKTGVEIWREGRQLYLDWSIIVAIHQENRLMVIETTGGEVHAVPAMPKLVQHFAAYQSSQEQGPWGEAKKATRAEAVRLSNRKTAYSRSVIWIIGFLIFMALINVVQAGPASTELLRDQNLPGWYNEVSERDRETILNSDNSENFPLFVEKIRVEEDHYHIVRQRFMTIRDRSMLENMGDVKISVDPNFERATLHRLRVHRDGKVLDQISIPLQALRREESLGDGVINGDIEYFGQIADLRKGDTIEMIWSKWATTPVFPDHFHHWAGKPRPTGWKERRTTIDLPATTKFYLKHTRHFNVSRSDAEDRTVLAWSLSKADKKDSDIRSAEVWDASNDGLQLSTFRDWAEVVGGLVEDYQARPDSLPGDLVELLEDIAEQSDDPEWRATQAFRLVQDRVRYFSVSIGEGGWIPREPGEVWASAFGDCKDKALLLISMLAKLQIEADVVLVDREFGPALKRMLPSPFIFDHAIVRVRNPRGHWFIDPTDLLQGGVGPNIAHSDFAWGLPLSDDSSGLVIVAQRPPEKPTYEVLQEYEFLDQGPNAAILKVTDIWRGTEADNRRWIYDGDDMESRRKQLEKWYAKRFPGAKHPDEPLIQDDLDANVIKLVQRYTLPREGFLEKGLWTKLRHYGYGVSGELYEFDDDEYLEGHSRLNDPLFSKHKVVMKNVPAPLSEPWPRRFNNRFVEFESGGEWDEEESRWTYEWKLRTKETTLKPGDEAAWREAVNFVEDHDHYVVNLHRRFGGVLANQPCYKGFSPIQLSSVPVFIVVLLMSFWLFRFGARSAVKAAEEYGNENNRSSKRRP